MVTFLSSATAIGVVLLISFISQELSVNQISWSLPDLSTAYLLVLLVCIKQYHNPDGMRCKPLQWDGPQVIRGCSAAILLILEQDKRGKVEFRRKWLVDKCYHKYGPSCIMRTYLDINEFSRTFTSFSSQNFLFLLLSSGRRLCFFFFLGAIYLSLVIWLLLFCHFDDCLTHVPAWVQQALGQHS